MGCTCPRTVCWTQHGANVKTQDDRERKQKTHLAHWVLNLSAKKQNHFPSFHHEKRDCHGFAFCSHQISRLVTVSAVVLFDMLRTGLQFRAVTTNCVSSLWQERFAFLCARTENQLTAWTFPFASVCQQTGHFCSKSVKIFLILCETESVWLWNIFSIFWYVNVVQMRL